MNLLLLRSALAVLPLLGLSLEAESGFLYGAVCSGVLLIATSIFIGIRGLLPRVTHPLSFFLLLLVLGVMAQEVFALSFLFIPSSLLLVSGNVFQKHVEGRRLMRSTARVAVLFLVLLSAHGMCSELLGERAGFEFFRMPAGSYFLLGLVFACIPQRLRTK